MGATTEVITPLLATTLATGNDGSMELTLCHVSPELNNQLAGAIFTQYASSSDGHCYFISTQIKTVAQLEKERNREIGAMTLFEEDSLIANAVMGVADVAGMAVIRRPTIDVDPKQLDAKYLVKAPDWKAIRKALEDGIEVPGARFTGATEYVIHRRGTEME